MLEVLSPGLLDTVQDGGRPGARDLGVPASGACDAWSLAVANAVLGNELDAAALEITASGPTLAVQQTCVVALAGADLGAHVPEEDRPLPVGTAQLVHAGTRIVFERREDGRRRARHGHGLRTYLALAGGIDVPVVMGSRSTCLAGGFGGLDGRPLRAGDLLRPRSPTDLTAAGRRWPAGGFEPTARRALRLLTGPPTLAAPCPGAQAALVASIWRVRGSADRMGIRLAGPPLAVDAVAAATLVSRGVLPGAVQVLPDGSPLVLLADAQTVGGYPVAGVVAAADLLRAGQLRPGDTVRFRAATTTQVRAAARSRARTFAELRTRLDSGTSWDLLADAAG